MRKYYSFEFYLSLQQHSNQMILSEVGWAENIVVITVEGERKVEETKLICNRTKGNKHSATSNHKKRLKIRQKNFPFQNNLFYRQQNHPILVINKFYFYREEIHIFYIPRT